MRQNPIGLQRLAVFVLVLSVLATSVGYAADDAPLSAARAKQSLQARGVGKMVKVKQVDGTELRAKIVSIGETSAVIQVGSKPTIDVPYDRMAAVKGPGLSRGVKTTIIVVIVVWLALLYPATHT